MGDTGVQPCPDVATIVAPKDIVLRSVNIVGVKWTAIGRISGAQVVIIVLRNVRGLVPRYLGRYLGCLRLAFPTKAGREEVNGMPDLSLLRCPRGPSDFTY